MAIQSELLNDGALIRHWSDVEGMVLLQVETGAKYPEAIDLHPCRYTYEEAEPDPEPAPDPEPEPEPDPEPEPEPEPAPTLESLQARIDEQQAVIDALLGGE